MKRALMAVLLMLAAVAPAVAADNAHPFAKHFVALQLSQDAAAHEAMVLSVAYNLLKAYGPDGVVVEVVTFGPGVHLLYASNKQRVRIRSLMDQGVRFDICDNTLETIRREKGKVPPLDPGVHHVQAGVARLIELHEQGYAIVQP